MRDVHCYGKGWDVVPGVTIKHTKGKMDDPLSSIDILQHYTFALIFENCDAEGYVSEKMYDCLCAGCIPLYYGSPSPELKEVLGDVYVDLHQFETGDAVQAFVDGLQPEELYHMQARIEKKREAILNFVGVDKYASIFHHVYDTSKPNNCFRRR
jgi:hypothetical protein